MARLNKSRVDLKAFDQLMKDLDRKISIKVGIIGQEAQEKHEGTDLTNADLGAIHEFGTTINVTDKMKGWFWYNQGIHKSNKPIVIPTRSFLRGSLLTAEGQKELRNVVSNKIKTHTKNLSKENANKILDETAHLLAETAYLRVIKAFETDGFGQWEPTSEFSKQLRKKNKNESTLVDSGQLKKSISYAINGKQWAKSPSGDTK